MVGHTNTFITPTQAIQFRLSRDLRDEWRQGSLRCRESLIYSCETVELVISIIKSRSSESVLSHFLRARAAL
jgi:hypothetical protein